MTRALLVIDVQNQAGAVKAEELHRAILGSQQMLISEVLNSAAWETHL